MQETADCMLHPVYGVFQTGWKPCRDAEGQTYPLYEVNEQCQVRNTKTKHILSPSKQARVDLCVDRKSKMRHIYQLCLASFFPNVTPKATVDHIDENHDNNTLTNLQWATRREQNVKSHKLKPRNSGPARSKRVQQLTLNGDLIKVFDSTNQAGRVLKISASRIGACACGEKPTYRGFKWIYEVMERDKDLPGEEWKTSEWLRAELKARTKLSDRGIGKVRVSNMGRVQTSYGIKTKGTRKSRNPKNRVYTKSIQIHQLVWWAFRTDRPPVGLEICHDDTAPLDEDGCYTNALSTLRLDTHPNNMKECHAVGSMSKAQRGQKRTHDEMASQPD